MYNFVFVVVVFLNEKHDLQSWTHVLGEIFDCVTFPHTPNKLDFLKVLSNNTSLACWFCRWKRLFPLAARQIYQRIFHWWRKNTLTNEKQVLPYVIITCATNVTSGRENVCWIFRKQLNMGYPNFYQSLWKKGRDKQWKAIYPTHCCSLESVVSYVIWIVWEKFGPFEEEQSCSCSLCYYCTFSWFNEWSIFFSTKKRYRSKFASAVILPGWK